MRLSELLKVEVRTESGRKLGHPHDVRANLGASALRVTGLVVGRFGILERVGIAAPESAGRVRAHEALPWSAVVRADRGGIVVRDDAVAE